MTNPNHNPDPDNNFNPDKEKFLYPRSAYYGDFKPSNLVFNANLQEFAQKVNYICNLETAGKLTSEEAYQQIKSLWKKIKQSRKELGIMDDNNF
ncbi:hypothetical protein PN462_21285 [Spirulina sp. CS-785/01]|uniref:DUF7219 family protein n=1 Tax=Spirulina sp. CS-785/01 TaxID=3021716 RepID=UPI00232DC8AF|nr:hypothetical protein [Spirulina sp. CS-785/01]MDB9315661.1 hypothetical protein [Spirulina sp. CS-785/01]